MNILKTVMAVFFLVAGCIACSTQVVKTTDHTPVEYVSEEISEDQLLDVGVNIFDPGLDDIDDNVLVFPEVRKAESRYIPYVLTETLQSSAAWGAVRMIPNENNAVDVLVYGKIIQSDGEQLDISVTVEDATGKQWFSRRYTDVASRYAYDRRTATRADPFKGVYNRIANDMLEYRRKLSKEQIAYIRTVAELKFAKYFAPDTFKSHLEKGSGGLYTLKRLPAENDPMIERIRGIRDRDYLFVDTIQGHYGNFVKDMTPPYKQWRSQSYDEVMSMKALKRESRNRTISGVVAIVGGIATASGGHGAAADLAGTVAVSAGGYLIKGGMEKSAQSKMHVEALRELGDSLETSIEPQVIELEDRTITLSGSVENQYDEWRKVLAEIYKAETGQ